MNSLTSEQKAFNSTSAGQTAMCYDASSRSTVFMINSKVKSLGGESWDAAMIASANPSMLKAIMEDLLPIYNSLVK